MSVIAFVLVFELFPGGGAKNDTALAPLSQVMIITTGFGEFLQNCERGDHVMDGQTD